MSKSQLPLVFLRGEISGTQGYQQQRKSMRITINSTAIGKHGHSGDLPSPPLTMVYQACLAYPAVYTGEYPKSKALTQGNRLFQIMGIKTSFSVPNEAPAARKSRGEEGCNRK